MQVSRKKAQCFHELWFVETFSSRPLCLRQLVRATRPGTSGSNNVAARQITIAATRSAGSATPSALTRTIRARVQDAQSGEREDGQRVQAEQRGQDGEVSDLFAGHTDEPQAGDQHGAVDHDEHQHGRRRLADPPEQPGRRIPSGTGPGPRPTPRDRRWAAVAGPPRRPPGRTRRRPAHPWRSPSAHRTSSTAAIAPPSAIQSWIGSTSSATRASSQPDHRRDETGEVEDQGVQHQSRCGRGWSRPRRTGASTVAARHRPVAA